jgi:hypothetical protein
MAGRGTYSLDERLYRVALSLCPAGFRVEHGDELARDFDEARGEALADGDRGLWSFRLLMAADLARTVTVQWFRTGIPVTALASAVLALTLAAGLASVARRATFPMPSDPADAEILGVLLLAVTSVVIIAMTASISLWVNRPRRRGRR